ncbi:MAG: pyrroloquinoline quinone-dependent dehydrogenase [Myxococcota bacterium]
MCQADAAAISTRARVLRGLHALPSGALWLLLAAAAGLGCGTSEPAWEAGGEVAGWSHVGGDPGSSHYSPLTQIDRRNVDRLELAWSYRTGDYPGARPELGKTAFQATPVLDGDTLYFCSPANRIFALDAETGAERWVFDAEPVVETSWSRTCRGVALWRGVDAGAPDAACARRVFMGTMDARLVAVDAETGRPCPDFGAEDGRGVDLRAGLGEIEPGEYYVTSPPSVVGDVVAVGALVADNRRVDGPGGVVRGFDVRTGELRWAFDPVAPGTPPPAADGGDPPLYHRGTANVWSIASVDPERGWIFLPFGSPSPDYFGGHRGPEEHYANSVVALDGRSGRPVWHFQVVHHDLWDYDVASPPTLFDHVLDGRPTAAVAQATKMGHVFLLDRETGRPLHPVEERPVARSRVPGERTAPTQPFPTFPAPLHPARIDPDDAFGFTPFDRGACREKLAALRNEGIFTPPDPEGSIEYPSTAGGANWGGVAIDPERRLLVLNQTHLAQAVTMFARDELGDLPPEELGRRYLQHRGTPWVFDNQVLVSPLGIPCVPPPWGTLIAVDLVTGEKRWEVPFGTVRDMTPLPLPFEFGLPSMGGPIATAGGVVFIGASLDRYLRAYDVETGAELWKARLPAGGQATPMTYRLGPDRRQYVVIAAGGHSTLRTKLGDWVLAYALPERSPP